MTCLEWYTGQCRRKKGLLTRGLKVQEPRTQELREQRRAMRRLQTQHRRPRMLILNTGRRRHRAYGIVALHRYSSKTARTGTAAN